MVLMSDEDGGLSIVFDAFSFRTPLSGLSSFFNSLFCFHLECYDYL